MSAYKDLGNTDDISDNGIVNPEPRPRSSHTLGQSQGVQPTRARSPNTALSSHPTTQVSQSRQGLGTANSVISPNNTQLQEQKKETELARQNQNKFGLEQMARNEQSRQASATASVASTMASPRNVHHQSEQQQLSMQLQETCNELRKERESHEQSKIALQEQKKETEEARQSQKKIGIELNNIKAQQQRRYQVTDNELANLARQLRYQVSNIAHVHFKDEIEITDESIHDLWQLLTKNLPNFLLSREFFSRCMLDSASRPLIVNAILWNFLVHKIMGKLYWAGADASEGWTRLAGALNLVATDAATVDLDVVHKYQLWKAYTANLIAEREEPDEAKARADHLRLRQRLGKKLCGPLKDFTGSKHANLENDSSEIIDKVLELDQMISRQVADVSWETSIHVEHYNPQSMEPYGGGELQRKPNYDLVAVAPGMMKRGTSTGANFEVNNRLLRTEVATIRLPATRDVDKAPKVRSWTRQMFYYYKKRVEKAGEGLYVEFQGHRR